MEIRMIKDIIDRHDRCSPECETNLLNLALDCAGMDANAALAELEREFCRCGAGNDREKPPTWEYCGIHEMVDRVMGK